VIFLKEKSEKYIKQYAVGQKKARFSTGFLNIIRLCAFKPLGHCAF
jgi:hypothetical protein